MAATPPWVYCINPQPNPNPNTPHSPHFTPSKPNLGTSYILLKTFKSILELYFHNTIMIFFFQNSSIFLFFFDELIRFSENPSKCSSDYLAENTDKRYQISILSAILKLGEHYSGGKKQFESFLNDR